MPPYHLTKPPDCEHALSGMHPHVADCDTHVIIDGMHRTLRNITLAAIAVLTLGAAASPPRATAEVEQRELSPVAARLVASDRLSPSGADGAVLGLSPSVAERVFYPVSPWQALPREFEPPDLVRLGGIPRVLGQPVSAVVMPDLEVMVADAQRAGVSLVVLSAYRAYDEQDAIFERNVLRTLYRGDRARTREEAETETARFSARPGHSQHQLGTAIDFTSPEVGYSLGARFADSDTGRWLTANGWRYGFVFPYTEAGETRSGYRSEPWHVRWVGRELAAIMHADGYMYAKFPIADDYVLAAHELLTRAEAQRLRSTAHIQSGQ